MELNSSGDTGWGCALKCVRTLSCRPRSTNLLVEGLADKRLYVLRRLGVKDFAVEDRQEVCHEVRILGGLRHVFLLSCYGSFEEKTYINLLTDYAERGSLRHLLPAADAETVIAWMVQLALALAYTHSQGLLHYDVTLDTVFVNGKGLLKLGDFGLRSVLSRVTAEERRTAQAPFFTVPEVRVGLPYSESSDLWAFAGVAKELLKHCQTFAHNSTTAENLTPAHLLDADYFAIKKVLDSMASPDPRCRPSLPDFLLLDCIKRRTKSLPSVVRSELAAFAAKHTRAAGSGGSSSAPAPAPAAAAAPQRDNLTAHAPPRNREQHQQQREQQQQPPSFLTVEASSHPAAVASAAQAAAAQAAATSSAPHTPGGHSAKGTAPASSERPVYRPLGEATLGRALSPPPRSVGGGGGAGSSSLNDSRHTAHTASDRRSNLNDSDAAATASFVSSTAEEEGREEGLRHQQQQPPSWRQQQQHARKRPATSPPSAEPIGLNELATTPSKPAPLPPTFVTHPHAQHAQQPQQQHEQQQPSAAFGGNILRHYTTPPEAPLPPPPQPQPQPHHNIPLSSLPVVPGHGKSAPYAQQQQQPQPAAANAAAPAATAPPTSEQRAAPAAPGSGLDAPSAAQAAVPSPVRNAPPAAAPAATTASATPAPAAAPATRGRSAGARQPGRPLVFDTAKAAAAATATPAESAAPLQATAGKRPLERKPTLAELRQAKQQERSKSRGLHQQHAELEQQLRERGRAPVAAAAAAATGDADGEQWMDGAKDKLRALTDMMAGISAGAAPSSPLANHQHPHSHHHQQQAPPTSSASASNLRAHTFVARRSYSSSPGGASPSRTAAAERAAAAAAAPQQQQQQPPALSPRERGGRRTGSLMGRGTRAAAQPRRAAAAAGAAEDGEGAVRGLAGVQLARQQDEQRRKGDMAARRARDQEALEKKNREHRNALRNAKSRITVRRGPEPEFVGGGGGAAGGGGGGSSGAGGLGGSGAAENLVFYKTENGDKAAYHSEDSPPPARQDPAAAAPASATAGKENRPPPPAAAAASARPRKTTAAAAASAPSGEAGREAEREKKRALRDSHRSAIKAARRAAAHKDVSGDGGGGGGGGGAEGSGDGANKSWNFEVLVTEHQKEEAQRRTVEERHADPTASASASAASASDCRNESFDIPPSPTSPPEPLALQHPPRPHDYYNHTHADEAAACLPGGGTPPYQPLPTAAAPVAAMPPQRKAKDYAIPTSSAAAAAAASASVHAGVGGPGTPTPPSPLPPYPLYDGVAAAAPPSAAETHFAPRPHAQAATPPPLRGPSGAGAPLPPPDVYLPPPLPQQLQQQQQAPPPQARQAPQATQEAGVRSKVSSKIESLREALEQQLGAATFVAAYQKLQDAESGAEDSVLLSMGVDESTARVADRMLYQLVELEELFYG